MGLRETFQIVVDVVTESGQKSLKDLKNEVQNTDGAFGKIKVAGAGAMDYVKDHAMAFAAGAGVAIAGFALESVKAFEDTAKAAIDMSKTTGLSIEDASRWIGVGHDYEIGADTMTTSIGKISKSIDDVKWKQFGIDTRDATGHAKDANQILLDTLTKLSAMPDKTAQAEEGFKLFGKGFGAIAPLLGHTRDEYKSMLSTVESGQVITEAEARKAERMRLAQDALKDSLKEVGLAAGQLAADLSPLVSGLAKLITGVTDSIDAWGSLGSKMDQIAQGQIAAHKKKLDDLSVSTAGLGRDIDGAAGSYEDFKVAQDDATKSTDAAKKTADDMATALDNERQRLLDVRSEVLASIDKQYAYAQSQRDARQAIDEATAALKDHSKSADEQANAVEKARSAVELSALAYANSRGDVAGSQAQIDDMTKSIYIQAASMAPDSPVRKGLQDYINLLNGIPAAVDTKVTFHRDSFTTPDSAGDGATLTSPMYAPTYNIHIDGAQMSPEAIINAIKTYERKNGPGWKTSAI